jgi:hypothetical protein
MARNVKKAASGSPFLAKAARSAAAKAARRSAPVTASPVTADTPARAVSRYAYVAPSDPQWREGEFYRQHPELDRQGRTE